MVDGSLKVVTNALGSAASRLPQTDAPADVIERARGVLEVYQSRVSESEKETGMAARLVEAFKQVCRWVPREKQESVDDFTSRVYRSFSNEFNYETNYPAPLRNAYLVTTYTDHVIMCSGEHYYSIPFTDDGDEIHFALFNEWTPVEKPPQQWITKVTTMKAEGQTVRATELSTGLPMVMKQKNGEWRWVTLSSNAFEDTDGETVSRKALVSDIEASDRAGVHGELDWWRVL